MIDDATAIVISLIVIGVVALTLIGSLRRVGDQLGRRRVSARLKRLSVRDRVRVRFAVGRGLPVADPRLAPAAVDLARHHLRWDDHVLNSRWRHWPVIFGTAMIATGIGRLRGWRLWDRPDVLAPPSSP